jgi:hypothetical protein
MNICTKNYLTYLAVACMLFIYTQLYSMLFHNAKYIQKTKSKNFECSPFNMNQKMETFDFNGVQYPSIVPRYYNKTINFDCLSRIQRKFSILIYTVMDDGLYDFDVAQFADPNLLKNSFCPVHNCHFTYDKDTTNTSDAILFNFRNWNISFPTRYSENQKWIFYSTESPVHFPIQNVLKENYDNYSYYSAFNWTATYRLDSDTVSFFYAKSLFTWSYNEEFDDDLNFFENKTEFAVQIASVCQQISNRHVLINELKKYVNVSVYGYCSGIFCPIPNEQWGNFECKVYLASKYKFFFAFENSICKDYMTEKFFDILKLNVIPVVYGAGPYDKYVPKSGYINVFDFPNVKDLADYLIKVGSNKDLYNSFFKWKKFIRFEYKKPNPVRAGQFCDICIKLNLDHKLGSPKSAIPYADIRKYWYLDSNCKNYYPFENGKIQAN